MNLLLLCLSLFFSKSTGYCEVDWTPNYTIIYNITDPAEIHEIGNAISSLVYCGFGVTGLMLKNYSTMYYLIMNLFILQGITSCLFHYSIYSAMWHAADVICMELLAGFSLLYIVYYNQYTQYNQYKTVSYIRKCLNLIILTLIVSMLVLFKIDYEERTLLLEITIGCIIITQVLICTYFFYIKYIFRFRILFSSLLNGALFSFGVTMWHIDIVCPQWMWNRFNGHSLWHICLAWALFNVINITNIFQYNYIYSNRVIIWRPLFKCAPIILYVIIIHNHKSNKSLCDYNVELKHIIHIDKTANKNIEEIKLLSNKTHRRNKTIG